jgi:hypothetical protein
MARPGRQRLGHAGRDGEARLAERQMENRSAVGDA